MKLTKDRAANELRRMGVDQYTIDEFFRYLELNQPVWDAFVSYTLDAIKKNRVVGAKAVMERVRWEVEIDKQTEFKVNNNYTAYFARLFSLFYPQHSAYFETRETRGLTRV